MPVRSQSASYANTKLTIVSNSRSSSSNSRERTNERRYCMPTTKGKNSRHLIFGCIKKNEDATFVAFFLHGFHRMGMNKQRLHFFVNIMMSRAICTGSVFQFHFFFFFLHHGMACEPLKWSKWIECIELHRKCHWFRAQVNL